MHVADFSEWVRSPCVACTHGDRIFEMFDVGCWVLGDRDALASAVVPAPGPALPLASTPGQAACIASPYDYIASNPNLSTYLENAVNLGELQSC